MRTLWCVLLSALVLSSCGNIATTGTGNQSTSPSQSSRPQSDTRKVDPQVVTAYNQFGFDLLSTVRAQEEDKNVILSPTSVAMALSMVYHGAAGETQQAMAKALHLQETPPDKLNQMVLDLRHSLQSIDPKVELSIANSLWARQGIDFKQVFLQANQRYYGAQISVLDFANPEAPKTINRWVDSQTKGKIQRIVDRIPHNTVLFLINAVYFNGKWQTPFDKELTQQKPFHLTNGELQQVPMMQRTGRLPYLKGEGFQAVSLPYGGGRMSMVLVLPDENVGLSAWLKSLDIKRWQELTTKLVPSDGELQLPRFKVEYEKSLSNALKALGMEVAFDPDRADLTGMREVRDLFIQEVKHKTVVDVNEEGTEAAAVTSVQVGITSVQEPRRPFRMVIDRPFFFAIRDNRTGLVLFMGAVYEPQ